VTGGFAGKEKAPKQRKPRQPKVLGIAKPSKAKAAKAKGGKVGRPEVHPLDGFGKCFMKFMKVLPCPHTRGGGGGVQKRLCSKTLAVHHHAPRCCVRDSITTLMVYLRIEGFSLSDQGSSHRELRVWV